jgi:endonuclease-3
MFCYNRPALPVDTHVHRVAGRLGLIDDDCAAGPAHEALELLCPPKLVYPFHLLLVEHGRKVCRARRPLCLECVLAKLCPACDRIPTADCRAKRRAATERGTRRAIKRRRVRESS